MKMENIKKGFDNPEYIEYSTVLYGAGRCAREYYVYFDNIKYICDLNAKENEYIGEIRVSHPKILEEKREKYKIIVCIKNDTARHEAIESISKMNIEAVIFDLFEDESFNTYYEQKYERKEGAIRYVNLVCQEDGWILNKFANKMKVELEEKGIKATIDSCPNPKADINHFIAHHFYQPICSYNDSLMITHVDSVNKVNLIKHQLNTAKIGICMSKQTMEMLISFGVQREKLCYINPAQDGVIKPRKYVLGMTYRNHDDCDNRSRSGALLDICKCISPDYFSFKIMGDGWENHVDQMRDMGFEVEYYDKFDYEEYINLMPSIDYYLYWGFDEGNMGYLDALAAGVGTIVTPQGYHLDVKDGITYACRTIPDFVNVLLELENTRRKRSESVKEWTWKSYVEKHLEVWKYVLGYDEELFVNQHKYEDGLYSMLRLNA